METKQTYTSTPGPWKITEDRVGWPDGHLITGWGTNILAVVHDTGNDLLSRDGIANTKLIAVAPDLLTSCDELLEMFGEAAPYSLDPRAIRARAAIVKATT